MTEPVSNSREAILRRVSKATSELPERAVLPEYPQEIARSNVRLAHDDAMENFRVNFELAHGRLFASIEEVKEYFIEHGWNRGFCDPEFHGLFHGVFASDIELLTEFDAANADSYHFGITGTAGAIAETGSIILNDATTSNRFGALAPWVHLAVVKRSSLHSTIAEAIAMLGDDPYVIWVTGPSKTADVEGILVEGVHGPGIQGCLFI